MSISVLVTSGGVREEIDAVRSITNHSTGRLGSLIADAFSESGARVVYLCGETAARPSVPVEETVIIRNTAQLLEAFESLLSNRRFDCVIHSMAVSDYTPRIIMPLEDPAALDSTDISSQMQAANGPVKQKLDSEASNLLLVLEKTPKVINRVKELSPGSLLVGFKLLSDVGEAELLAAGYKLMSQSGCDYVLANDLTGINEDTHKAILMDKTGVLQRLGEKSEIARAIQGQVMADLFEYRVTTDERVGSYENRNIGGFRQYRSIQSRRYRKRADKA